MFLVNKLYASIEDASVLKGIDLEMKPGEIHAIMGPNGAGKSTLSKVIAGHPSYTVTSGDIQFLGQSILEMAPEERARAGIFMSFQYPIEIPGVSNIHFLRASVNAIYTAQGKPTLDANHFLKFVREKCADLDMDEGLLYRNLHEGFSGGEKKRNEILQMRCLEPKLAVLDETDSGLDIDALRVIAKGVNAMRDPNRAILLVTHYQRLLDYIQPDKVHVLMDGRIIRSGDRMLAHTLEEKGYAWLEAASC